MHRALSTAQVLAGITGSLHDDDCFKSLVDFATTCRLAFLPAMSQVWAEADFIHFIQVLDDALCFSEYMNETEDSEALKVVVSSFACICLNTR